MRDPVRVNLGKGVQSTVERETAEAEGMKLAADQSRSNLWAHGRLRGTTIKGEVPEVAEIPTPKTTDSKSAGGASPKEASK